MQALPTIIIGAGLAGLSAAVALSAKGERVLLLEKQGYVGGKMREVHVAGRPVDSGPTVFTMKWVFDRLFEMAGTSVERELELDKAETLARHAWDDTGTFDLFADSKQSEAEIERFFGPRDAAGFRRFCSDSAQVFDTLKDTYIAASCPSPTQLAARVGVLQVSKLLNLKPFHTLWRALSEYFPDPRLRQLYGRYATYVGSSPFLAPATLMLIAHVEQEGVWFVKGGMHRLAKTMANLAEKQGADIRLGCNIAQVLTKSRKATGVKLASGEVIEAQKVLYCGDVSRLTQPFINTVAVETAKVPPSRRSLSAITWSAHVATSGFDLKRHNVFFSGDYAAEFNQIFKRQQVPSDPTVYVCAQDRESETDVKLGTPERLLCLINAPAYGDKRQLSDSDVAEHREAMRARLASCGLTLDVDAGVMQPTQPAGFNALFPSSGGALYGRASHGWTASFARPGATTKVRGLYLAGGSVHPGAGVPMATLSGMLAAEEMIKDRAA